MTVDPGDWYDLTPDEVMCADCGDWREVDDCCDRPTCPSHEDPDAVWKARSE